MRRPAGRSSSEERSERTFQPAFGPGGAFVRRQVEKATPLWQAWPQVALAGFCLIFVALLWTAAALQWTAREQHGAQQAAMTRAAERVDVVFDEWQQRAAALATLASQLLGESRPPLHRVALEAALQTAISMPGSTLNGILLLDPAGRPIESRPTVPCPRCCGPMTRWCWPAGCRRRRTGRDIPFRRRCARRPWRM
jgi:hypothetical protein